MHTQLQGDYGGPLICQANIEKEPDVLVGIAANLKHSCTKYFKKAGIFTNVGHSMEWIKKEIQMSQRNVENSAEDSYNISFPLILLLYLLFLLQC